MNTWVCGWDIGGAHLKFALRDPAGRWVGVRQLPCPLWQGTHRLSAALQEAVRDWPVAPGKVLHAATMTGELVDAFPDRAAGVRAIVGCVESAFGAAAWRWFGLDGLLHDPSIAHDDPLRFASANWLASASCAARHASGLFIDIGSTTTDIVRLDRGIAQPCGLTDGERLSAGELVYRGVVRTPLMAVAEAVEWRGAARPLMAEHFATSADVFRLSGDLDEHADAWPAADGGEKTRVGSARRLARLIGEDLEAAGLEAWQGVANQLADAMTGTIVAAAERVLGDTASAAAGGGVASSAGPPTVVCAGAGHWLAARVAARLGAAATGFDALIGAGGVAGACEHAPAVALAELAGAAADEHQPAGCG